MQDLFSPLATVIAAYADDTSHKFSPATRLSGLGIDEMDTPMLLIDLEDAFDISISAALETQDLKTVGDLLALVRASLETKRLTATRSAPRRKSNWMSTSARA